MATHETDIMSLDELGVPATVRADLERTAEELGMSDDILIGHILGATPLPRAVITSGPVRASRP